MGVTAEPAATVSSGLAPRRAAVAIVTAALHRGAFLEDALEEAAEAITDTRDRAFAHALAATALRRKGQTEKLLAQFMEKPLDRKAEPAGTILLIGATQILFLAIEPHAAISTSVELAARDAKAGKFKQVVNAVLRRVAENRDELLSQLPPALSNLPTWLERKLRADLGPADAAGCAEAHLAQPDLDLTPKDAEAARILVDAGGQLLPTGSVRFAAPYPAIPALPGFAEGHWWVQDAAAALPARMLGNVAGLAVLDMCAAPGGKTLQLAAAGANVTALDVSEQRLRRVAGNLARTGLATTCIAMDALQFEPDQLYDAILLDAPCSATGTIRRHPELPWSRRADDLKTLVGQQRQLLRHAASLLKPGGALVYAVCSLFADEGAKQVQSFLNENRAFTRLPVDPQQLGISAGMVNRHGDLRTLPHMQLDGIAGMDGFYAARLLKAAS